MIMRTAMLTPFIGCLTLLLLSLPAVADQSPCDFVTNTILQAEQDKAAWTQAKSDNDSFWSGEQVSLSKLMTDADLIVVATCDGSVMREAFSIGDTTYQFINKLRVNRVIASRWSPADTRQHMTSVSNTCFVYLAIRQMVDAEIVNDPALVLHKEYLLWLRLVSISAADLTSAGVTLPVSRTALYAACVGKKGCVPLDAAPREQALGAVAPEATNLMERIERETRTRDQQYYLGSFNTTNRGNILNAVRALAKAMAGAPGRPALLADAQRNLNMPTNIDLAALAATPRFKCADYVPE